MKRHPIATFTAAALLMASGLTMAEQQPDTASTAQPAKGVALLSSVTATVEAIDPNSRTVTLKAPDGEIITLQLGDDVRNFSQIVVGDKVTAEYYEALIIGLTEKQRDFPTRKETITTELAALGTKPAKTVSKTITADAVVEAIDLTARTVTVRGTDRTLTLKVADDIDLTGIEPGDEVQAIYSETVAVSVTSNTAPEDAAE